MNSLEGLSVVKGEKDRAVDNSCALVEPPSKSKNALKRELKAQFVAEKRREKKRLKRARRDVLKGNDSSKQTMINCDPNPEAVEARKKRKLKEDQEFHDLCSTEYAVIIDCNFEDSHNDRAIVSLTSQLGYCHGINKRSKHPSHIYFTGLGSRTLTRLSMSDYKNWRGVTVSSDEFTEIEALKDREIIYLTADSDVLLETLDPKAAYVIGGIVDRNSLKGITQQKAEKLGIKTARLPIIESLSYKLSSSHVLTVNHVMSIMKKYSESLSWQEAIEEVIPERKADGRESKAQRRMRNRENKGSGQKKESQHVKRGNDADVEVDKVDNNTE